MDQTKRDNEFDWAGSRASAWAAALDRMEAMLAPFDAPLIDALDLAGARRIADVACGGGGTTRAIRARADASAEVLGVDLSNELIEAARARTTSDAAITYHCADLSIAAPPGGTFDRLSARFGVMFFDHPPTAFANLARWLAPEGRFAFAVWAKPEVNPWTLLLREVIARHVPLKPPIPDSPGPFRYGDVTMLIGLLEAAGLSGIATRTIEAPLRLGGGLDAERAADFALDTFSIAEPVVRGDASTRAAVRAALIEALEPYVEAGEVVLSASAHLVTGAR